MSEYGIFHNAFATGLVFASILAGSHANAVAAQDAGHRLESVRELYLRSATDDSAIDSAVAILSGLPEGTESAALIEAYSGAFVVMRAKHAFWPGRKLAYVRRGLRTLDRAVAADSLDAEIRYLRLASCYYLPGLFGRAWSVEEDFQVLAVSVRDLRPKFDNDFYTDLVRLVIENAEMDDGTRDELQREIRSLSANSSLEVK